MQPEPVEIDLDALQPPKGKDENEAYNLLVREVDLLNLFLESMSAGHVEFLDPDAPHPDRHLATSLEYFMPDGGIAVRVKVDTSLRAADEETRYAGLECSYLIFYRSKSDDLTKALVDRSIPVSVIEFFVARHARTHVWPYVRELVSSTYQRMGVGDMLLPLRPTI